MLKRGTQVLLGLAVVFILGIFAISLVSSVDGDEDVYGTFVAHSGDVDNCTDTFNETNYTCVGGDDLVCLDVSNETGVFLERIVNCTIAPVPATQTITVDTYGAFVPLVSVDPDNCTDPADNQTYYVCVNGDEFVCLDLSNSNATGIMKERIVTCVVADDVASVDFALPVASCVDLGYNDGTLDFANNLMWEKAVRDKDYDYSTAKMKCQFADTGGYGDWRLPTKDELIALFAGCGDKVYAEETMLYWTSDIIVNQLTGDIEQSIVVNSSGEEITGTFGEIVARTLCVRDETNTPKGLASCRLGESFSSPGYFFSWADTCGGTYFDGYTAYSDKFNVVGFGNNTNNSLSLFNNGLCVPGSWVGKNSCAKCWFKNRNCAAAALTSCEIGGSTSTERQNITVDCGDPDFDKSSCQLCSRSISPLDRVLASGAHLDRGSLNLEDKWDCVDFDGTDLEMVFNSSNQLIDGAILDFKVDCSANQEFQDSCQLCRNYTGTYDCVDFGDDLITDITNPSGTAPQFDLSMNCDIAATAEKKEVDYFKADGCFDLDGVQAGEDHCGEEGDSFTLYEYSNNETGGCVVEPYDCPSGCGDGACYPPSSFNDVYFVYSGTSDFDVTLNEIVGNNIFALTDFRNTRFKLVVDNRMISAVSNTEGYNYTKDISVEASKDEFAIVGPINKHNYEDDEKVPMNVFEAVKLDFSAVNEGEVLDLSSEVGSDDLYLFRNEIRGIVKTGNIPVQSFRKGYDITSQSDYAQPEFISTFGTSNDVTYETLNITDKPDKTSGVFTASGQSGTYAEGFYIYVDSAGELHFQYDSGHAKSRALLSVGVLECECESTEDGQCIYPSDTTLAHEGGRLERCDGCSWVNQGKNVGHCGVTAQCNDDDGGKDYFRQGLTVDGEGYVFDECNEAGNLVEYSCGPVGRASEEYVCDLGCKDGACVKCDDPDGQNYFEASTARGYDPFLMIDENDDFCTGDYVVEMVCNDKGQLKTEQFECINGCTDGACNEVECGVNTTACDGVDLLKKGTVSYTSEGGGLTKLCNVVESEDIYGAFSTTLSGDVDNCTGVDNQTSYTCVSNEEIICLDLFSEILTDPDTDEEVEVTSERIVECVNESVVEEIIVKYSFDSETECAIVSECSQGTQEDGSCISSVCTDPDEGSFENYSKTTVTGEDGNTLTDTCDGTTTLSEAVCSEDGLAVVDSRECEFGCNNGKCIGDIICNDGEDKGLNYFKKGAATSCVGDVCAEPLNESCADDNTVWESYCNRDNTIVWQKQLCPAGCVDGACSVPISKQDPACENPNVGGPNLQPGLRVIDGVLKYCDPFTLQLINVRDVTEACNNDYECQSNICIEGECANIRGELERQTEILEEQAGLLRSIRCYLRDLLGIEDYAVCLPGSQGA